MAKPQLRLVSPYHKATGYCVMGRAVLRTAMLAGYEVEAQESDLVDLITHYVDGHQTRERQLPKALIPLPEQQERELAEALHTRVEPEAPTLAIQLPYNLASWPQYSNGALIGWTMTESDGLCREWQHGCRNVDLLVAPSRYCHDTFKRVMPDVPSDYMPIPVDDRLWSPNEYLEEVPGRPPFLFLSVFSTCERKNWRMLIQAFAEEFAEQGDEVGLVVKPGRADEVAELVMDCRHMGAWITLDTEKRTAWTMGGLYRACNVVVQPSSEGYGLPFVEAAMCGRPGVGLALSGTADVLTEGTGYVIPSHMEPLIGHMPQAYPRTHNFAACTIDDLRATLRRAYETEKAGEGKGSAAHDWAMANLTPKVLAPRFREIVERGRKQAYINRKTMVCEQTPRWAVVAGAWGDVMCCVGKVRQLMQDHELDQIGIVFYGWDRAIGHWLELQPWCREVVALVETDRRTMTRTFALLSQVRGYHSPLVLADLLRNAGRQDLLDQVVAFTHLRLNQWELPSYWEGAILPADAYQWADDQATRIGRPFWVLNPVSLASVKMRDHWRGWSEAVSWLSIRGETLNQLYVITGEQPIKWPDHPNLLNLSGKTRTMMDLLALAELSQGCITTSNNLAIYAPIAGIPMAVACARTSHREAFYHRWMEHPTIQLVDFDDAMPQFIRAVENLPLNRYVPQIRGDVPEEIMA